MALSLRLAITADRGVSYFHHNIDPGKVGLILDANTPCLLRIGEH